MMEEKSSDPRYAALGVSRMPEKIGPRGRTRRALVLIASIAWACTPASGDAAWTGSDALYTRRDARLFDDLFRPELFGVEHTVEPPERDSKLQERTAFADSVSRTKVVTVTRGGALAGTSYTIVLRPEGRPLAGRALPDPLTLVITRGSPTYAWLEAAGQAWVGTRLILFARLFTDGLHYHATSDSEAVRKVIEHTAAMQILDK
jgi:hypothetical protein